MKTVEVELIKPHKDIISEIQVWYKGPPRQKPSEDLVRRGKYWFGSWKNALMAANVHKSQAQNPDLKFNGCMVRRKAVSSPTAEDVICALKEFAATNPDSLAVDAFVRHSGIRKGAVLKRFVTWNKALVAAGLEPEPYTPHNYIPDKLLIEDIKRVAGELGGTPSKTAYSEKGSYGSLTIIRRFGGWRNALAASGLSTASTVYGRRAEIDAAGRKVQRRRYKKAKRNKRREAMVLLGVPPRPKGSKTQSLLTRMLAEALVELGYAAEFEEEKTFDWLKRPGSDSNLRLDAYFPAVGLAFEYQSELHFREVKWFKNSLKSSVRNDYWKRQQLQAHGIILFELAFFEPQTPEFVRSKLVAVLGRETFREAC